MPSGQPASGSLPRAPQRPGPTPRRSILGIWCPWFGSKRVTERQANYQSLGARRDRRPLRVGAVNKEPGDGPSDDASDPPWLADLPDAVHCREPHTRTPLPRSVAPRGCREHCHRGDLPPIMRASSLRSNRLALSNGVSKSALYSFASPIKSDNRSRLAKLSHTKPGRVGRSPPFWAKSFSIALVRSS